MRLLEKKRLFVSRTPSCCEPPDCFCLLAFLWGGAQWGSGAGTSQQLTSNLILSLSLSSKTVSSLKGLLVLFLCCTLWNLGHCQRTLTWHLSGLRSFLSRVSKPTGGFYKGCKCPWYPLL